MSDVKVNRSPRELDERSHNERETEESQDMSWLSQGSLTFDPRLVPEGLQWGWIVTKIHHQPQDTSLAKRKGWVPIPANKYPALAYLCSGIDNKTDASAIIENGGQVLCERPLWRKAAEQKEYEKANHLQSSQASEFITDQGLNFDTNAKYSSRPNDFGK